MLRNLIAGMRSLLHPTKRNLQIEEELEAVISFVPVL